MQDTNTPEAEFLFEGDRYGIAEYGGGFNGRAVMAAREERLGAASEISGRKGKRTEIYSPQPAPRLPGLL